MGTIKVEIDLPDFEKEININMSIRKDGEVIYNYNTSSPFTGNKIEEESNKKLEKRIDNTAVESGIVFNKDNIKKDEPNIKAISDNKPSNNQLNIKKGGNMMGINI